MTGDGQCRKCVYGCKHCVSDNACLECDIGQALVNGVCASCPVGCITCNVCKSCNDGFYLDGDGNCSPCSGTCETCIGANYCLKCKRGWQLDGERCVMQEVVSRVEERFMKMFEDENDAGMTNGKLSVM